MVLCQHVLSIKFRVIPIDYKTVLYIQLIPDDSTLIVKIRYELNTAHCNSLKIKFVM